MVRANDFRELIAFKGTKVTPVSFHGYNCTKLSSHLPGYLKSGFVAMLVFSSVKRKINYLNLSFLPLNNGITNTVSVSLPGLFSLIFVEPEVISHRLYSLFWDRISSSGSLGRLQKKVYY